MGDFFSRKRLLPGAVRGTPSKGRDATHERPHPRASGNDPEVDDVFLRSTLVPEVPAEAHARALMAALEEDSAPADGAGAPKSERSVERHESEWPPLGETPDDGVR